LFFKEQFLKNGFERPYFVSPILFQSLLLVPELPEVETVRQGLEQTTLQQEIVDADVLLARTIAYPANPTEFIAGLKGKVIQAWQRRGKYLLAVLTANTRDTTLAEISGLGVHLRMTGQLLWVSPDTPLPKHTRVRILFKGNRELRFVDQRTFGQMWGVPAGIDPATVIQGLQNLGPEPFSLEFSLAYLAEKLRSSQRPIKTALLDQALVAGIGNIYADESLFRSGIAPTRRCCDLQNQEIERLHAAIIEVLATSIDVGGTSFSTFLSVTGVNGNYGGESWVYNRKGQPCRTCGEPISRIKLAGRSTHFCPQCQLGT
jgi:formamidopyrimidine-DNA glycosylase